MTAIRRSGRLAAIAAQATTAASEVGADIAVAEVSDSPFVEEEPKKGRKRKSKADREPEVYDIPDVEHRQTSFKGRLGYACLNTILRNKRPASQSVFCSRTCRIDTMKKNGMEWVKNLGKQNLKDMLEILKWNEENNIRFVRLSSNIFPFASHGEYGYSLFEEEPFREDKAAPFTSSDEEAELPGPVITETIPELLMQVGNLARQYGHRLTSHPGQFTQLGSPNPKVRASSIRELKYHTEMMDGMGLDQDGVMIIHGGGTYGDKAAALERLRTTIRDELPKNVRDRLVLENDELCYAAEDLLPVCEELDIPLVFDYHHHNLNPSSKGPEVDAEALVTEAILDPSVMGSPEDDEMNESLLSPAGITSADSSEAAVIKTESEPAHAVQSPSVAEILARANAIFKRRGIRPKQHHSEPRNGAITLMERRAHSDRCQRLPEVFDQDYTGEPVETDVDLMIEAKDKEQAVLHLYRIYTICDVKHESLRPPASEETKQTKGRKSGKKKKAAAVQESDSQGVNTAEGGDNDIASTDLQASAGVDVSPEKQAARSPRKRRRLEAISPEDENGETAPPSPKKRKGKKKSIKVAESEPARDSE